MRSGETWVSMNLVTSALAALPILYDLRTIWWLITRAPRNQLSCPCCGYNGRFRSFGFPPRLNAVCAKCGSRERHRLLRLYLDRTDILAGRDVLHFAPEPAMRSFIEGKAARYVGCDFNPKSNRDSRVDIEAIDLPSGSFDLIICNHVLEHVDDRRALGELRRVLRSGGTLLLMVPVVEGWSNTYENPGIVAPRDRAAHFGQWDHVRMYGADIRERIRAAGFSLNEFTAEEPDVGRNGLSRGEKVFVCS
jgi:SAM-dependent methyltransferase